jgi:hypothetical protein
MNPRCFVRCAARCFKDHALSVAARGFASPPRLTVTADV